MGYASRWFRNLLGSKKSAHSSPQSTDPASQPLTKERRRWSFVKSYREKGARNKQQYPHESGSIRAGNGESRTTETGALEDASYECEHLNRRSIVALAATGAVAEATTDSVQATNVVDKLNSSDRCSYTLPEKLEFGRLTVAFQQELAAVKIQAVFRGCLVSLTSSISTGTDV